MASTRAWVRTEDFEQLLAVVLHALEDQGSVVVLEGELAELPLPLHLECDLPSGFAQQAPESSDCLALALSNDASNQVMAALFGASQRLEQVASLHVYRHGVLAFLAADSFHSECLSVQSGAPDGFVEQLVAAGVAVPYVA